MEQIQQHIITNDRTEEKDKQEHDLLSQIEDRSKQEEILWKQKSRIKWLQEGERNTSFFHRSTIQHRMHNRITLLKNIDGTILETYTDIKSELVMFYEDLLSGSDLDREVAVQHVASHIPALVAKDQKTTLMRLTLLQ